LPLAVSGGFGEADVPSIEAAVCDIDIVIVGRSVVDAVDHGAVLRRLCAAVRSTGEAGTG
jgi:3-keto-L-gulonate-6-phosphate decarboxylase